MSLADVAGAAVLGVVLGVVTGLPVGVVNVAIVEAATRGQARHAIHIGLGGALADALHAAIAFVGVGRVVAEHPEWSKAMAIVAGCVVLGYALLMLRRQRVARPPERRFGVLTGFVLTAPNPAALGAWIAVAAALWPQIAVVPALALATAVGVGSAVWFALLARFIARLPAEHLVVRWLPRVAIALLAVIAVIGIVRAVSA